MSDIVGVIPSYFVEALLSAGLCSVLRSAARVVAVPKQHLIDDGGLGSLAISVQSP